MTFRPLAAIALAALFTLPQAATAQTREIMEFREASGQCDAAQKRLLDQFLSGETVTLRESVIYESGSRNPLATSTRLAPMTALTCHARSGDRILVSESLVDSAGRCGWIDADSVLQGLRPASSRPPLATTPQSAGCGSVRPMTVADFCRRLEDLGEPPSRTCLEPRAASSSIHAKFLVWNAAQLGHDPERRTLPYYAEPEFSSRVADIDIFTVLRIYDLRKSGEDLSLLIGSSEQRMLGWMKLDDGAVWYSRLAAFFSEGGTADLLSAEPHVPGAIPIASRPDALEEMLKGKEFRRYPVLLDHRATLPRDDARAEASYLEMGFIGRFCSGDAASGLCVEGSSDAPVNDPDLVRKSDILFLIDGTLSMTDYFKAVVKAVRNSAARLGGNPDYAVGVSVYGDHLDRSRTALRDDLRFRGVFPLGPLYDEGDLDGLSGIAPFPDDAIHDKPEALHAAIVRAAETTAWRGKPPRFIIHLGDHGDRIGRPADVAAALLEHKVFYLPVAVRGAYVRDVNRAFVDQTAAVASAHVLPSGAPMATEPLTTYQGAKARETEAQRVEAIETAIRSALDFGQGMKERALAQRLGDDRPGQAESRRYLPGYSKVLDAAVALYALNGRAGVPAQGFVISARGYAQAAPDGAAETNWDFFAAMRPDELGALVASFNNLCAKIRTSDAPYDLTLTVYDVLALLTGDVYDDPEAAKRAYFDREAVPLITRTMLGDGLLALVNTLGGTSQAALHAAAQFEPEVCRTALLLNHMQIGNRFDRPFDRRDGVKGALTWNPETRRHDFDASALTPHDWVFRDEMGDRVLFLPLSYLPALP